MNAKMMKIIIPFAVVLLLITLYFFFHKPAKAEALEKVSEFGRYQGYSEEAYDGAQRTSDFLTLADGTRLAYDLFLPTKKGVPAAEPLPALFKYTPYGRAWTVFDKSGHCNFCDLDRRYPWWGSLAMRFRAWVVPLVDPNVNGQIKDALSQAEWLGDMVKSGYAIIVVERPGTAASFGQFHADPEVITQEADEILNWIAAQSWSDGKIGMFGDSIQAQIQFQAASSGNPHLKAILPATTWMDSYSAVRFPGGVQNLAFDDFYANANQVFDLMATPVDQDPDGTLLAQARAERQNTSALAKLVTSRDGVAYRDDLTADKPLWMQYWTLYPLLDRINRAGVPVYLINGWYDIFARDNFLIYANLTGPKRLLVRPTDHAGIEAPGADIDYGAEAHRWFDYWLKGIDNGIMDEPHIHYYLQGVNHAQAYQSAEAWPLADQTVIHYYFASGESDTRVTVNAGTLVLRAPAAGPALDAYTIDYTTTTGKWSHWAAPALPHKYPNLRSRDAKALTYTTSPLETALNIIGHPVAHLWLRTDTPDLDVFIYLEEVDQNGNATYITQGNLRASHRTLNPAPFDNFGLPWHNHFLSELQPIPAGEPFELVFDLLPTAWHFAPGKQIRITVAFADMGNFNTPILDPAPTVQILRDVLHPSSVDIPIIQNLP
jgi:putative CocE/NonD family hydrolase